MARSEGTTTLTLRLSSKYAKTLKSVRRLKALITVNFTPPAPGESLSAEANASFVRVGATKATNGSAKASGRLRSPELWCRLAS